jgi:hypothetical protein
MLKQCLGKGGSGSDYVAFGYRQVLSFDDDIFRGADA